MQRLFIVFLFMHGMLCAQLSENSTIIRVDKGKKPAYLDCTGRALNRDSVKNAWSKTFPVHYMIPFLRKGKHGFQDREGNVIVAPIYDNTLFFGSERFAPVCLNEKWGIIRFDGSVLVPIEYDYAGAFGNGNRASVFKDGKLILVDTSGRLIPTEYRWKSAFPMEEYPVWSDNRLRVYTITDSIKDSRQCFIDEEGRLAIPDFFEREGSALAYFHHGICRVRKDNHYQIIDTAGRVLLRFGEDIMTTNWHNTNYSIFYEKGYAGVMNIKGEILIPPIYREVEGPDNGFFAVSMIRNGDEVMAFIDTNSNILNNTWYDYLGSFNDGLADYSIDRKHGYLDTLGKQVIPPLYDFAETFYNGLAIVANHQENATLFGVIDKKNRIVIPMEYDDIESYEGKLFVVTKGKRMGVLDRKANVVVPFEYKHIHITQLKNLGVEGRE